MENVPTIRSIQWKQIRTRVKSLNPHLTTLIDELSPGKDLPLYIIDYKFGMDILKFGQLQVPVGKRGTQWINDADIDSAIKEDLMFPQGLPLMMPLQGGSELWLSQDNRALPVATYTPGQLFSFESSNHLHPENLFCMSAGARTIFMGANINNTERHDSLRQTYRIKANASGDINNHWNIVSELVNSEAAACDWNLQMLVFGRAWHDKLASSDRKWDSLKLYLLKERCLSSHYNQNQSFYNFIYSSIQKKRNLKPNPYISDTAKHLLSMGAGAIPGLGVARDEVLAPISLIKEMYDGVYKLKNESPIIFIPKYYDGLADEAIYYSMQFPTTLEFSPRSRQGSSNVYDLVELKYILETYIEEGPQTISSQVMKSYLQNIQFQYFNLKSNGSEEIIPSAKISDYDLQLKDVVSQKSNVRFADTASFFRSCVMIKKQDKN